MYNPFNVTKASEYSDEEINKYWVNFSEKFIDPMDYTPKFILGGKGCGKTHLMRYYSLQLQKLRKGNFIEVLKEDKYLGIYSVLSIMDVSRFEGKNVSDDQWKSIFKYYFELYIGSIILKTLNEYIDHQKDYHLEEEFVKDITKLFLKKIILSTYNLSSLLDYVETERKKIDFEIENVAFVGSFNNVHINLKPGSLIFGIPQILEKLYVDFKEVKFIYLFDEYEKLFDWQKRYINSLVWEKQYPSTFWIGARKYGYTDMHTESGEELKKGSEYIPFFLDEYYQQNEKEFELFSRKLISIRLKHNNEKAIKDFEAKFKDGKEEVINIIKESKRGNYKHLRNLINEIKSAIKKEIISDKEKDIINIIKNIKIDTFDNPLEQKYKIYLFYQIWYEGKTKSLFDISCLVRDEFIKFKENKISKFYNIIDKYRSDFIAQLCEENNIEYYAFSGLNDYIKLAWGNPRVLLLLLKKTIEKAKIFQEHPLESGGEISLRAQYLAIKETSKWYLGDAELTGEKGSFVNTSINNMAKYFRLFRFSDKPTDTSVCAFNYGTEDISPNATEIIKLMELHSLIIRIENERKQKNSGKAEITYQLNRILAPNWNLPIARRGIADFNANIIEALFNPDYFNTFDSEYSILKNRMNAPFSRKDKINMQSLF